MVKEVFKNNTLQKKQKTYFLGKRWTKTLIFNKAPASRPGLKKSSPPTKRTKQIFICCRNLLGEWKKPPPRPKKSRALPRGSKGIGTRHIEKKFASATAGVRGRVGGQLKRIAAQRSEGPTLHSLERKGRLGPQTRARGTG